jgi:hypothetical protein
MPRCSRPWPGCRAVHVAPRALADRSGSVAEPSRVWRGGGVLVIELGQRLVAQQRRARCRSSRAARDLPELLVARPRVTQDLAPALPQHPRCARAARPRRAGLGPSPASSAGPTMPGAERDDERLTSSARRAPPRRRRRRTSVRRRRVRDREPGTRLRAGYQVDGVPSLTRVGRSISAARATDPIAGTRRDQVGFGRRQPRSGGKSLRCNGRPGVEGASHHDIRCDRKALS